MGHKPLCMGSSIPEDLMATTRAKDISGQRFGRLVAHSITDRRDSSGVAIWTCRCDCGSVCDALSKDLRSGHKASCGCLKVEQGKRAAIRHGAASHSSRSPEYRSWQSMLTRCYNKKYHRFDRYGGRGITVCDRWRESFENFLTDMGSRSTGTSIDRFPNPNGNYEPSNCRWATRVQQRNNWGEK